MNNFNQEKTNIVYNSIPEDFRKQIPDVFAIIFEYKKDLPDDDRVYVACGINYHLTGIGASPKEAIQKLKYNIVATSFVNHHVGNDSPFSNVPMLDTFSLRQYSSYGIIKTVTIKESDLIS